MDIGGIKAVMCEIPMFDNLRPEEVTMMADQLEFRRIPANTVIVREGTPGESVLFIVHGKVEVRKEAIDGKQQVVGTLGKGTSVGEMALVQDGAPRAATAVTLEATDILFLSRFNFEKVILKNPAIGIRILRNIASTLSQRLSHLSGRYADQK